MVYDTEFPLDDLNFPTDEDDEAEADANSAEVRDFSNFAKHPSPPTVDRHSVFHLVHLDRILHPSLAIRRLYPNRYHGCGHGDRRHSQGRGESETQSD